MVPLLCLVQPYDVSQDARVDIRAADGLSAEVFGLGGFNWLPAIETRPTISVECMSLDLDGRVQTARMTIGLAGDFAKNKAYKWTGAPISLWSAVNLEYVNRAIEFTGEVTNTRVDLERGVLRLTCQVSTSALDTDMLTEEFTGAGGATGEAEMRGTLKPAGFGVVQNIEPVWFDKTNWVGMIDGYGNTLSVQRLMEGASEWAPAVADYVDYDSLVTAITVQDIPPGRWGTCIAEGLIGLGAPPAYPIGVDATFGSNRLGAIAKRVMLTHGGVDPSFVDDASWDALDVSVPYDAHLWVKDQRNVRQVVEALAASGNATPIVTPQGKIVASRAVKTAAVATLDRSGSRIPRVTNWESAAAVPPYWQIKGRAARPANVLSFDQVLYEDELIDRGTYSPTETYRKGHIVWLDDGSSWLYINDTPTAGNYPEDPSAYWSPLTGTKGGIVTVRYPATPPADVPEGSIYYDELNVPYRRESGNLEFDGVELDFNGDPLFWDGYVRVQDLELLSKIEQLLAIDDDGVISISEKKNILIKIEAEYEAEYQSLNDQATLFGLTLTELDAARAAWLALRNSLVPAWDDITQPTPIPDRSNWDALIEAYSVERNEAKTILAGPTAVNISYPTTLNVNLDTSGNPQGLPITEDLIVFRGNTDITTGDGTTYSINTSAEITATIDSTLGSGTKGRITITDVTGDGWIEMTVTIDGISYPTQRLIIRTQQLAGVSGGATSGKRVHADGWVETWRDITVSANASSEVFTYGDGHVYSSWCRAWFEGGQGGANAQDNGPFIDAAPGVSSCTISNSRDTASPGFLFTWGM